MRDKELMRRRTYRRMWREWNRHSISWVLGLSNNWSTSKQWIPQNHMRRREAKNWWNQRDISWDSWIWSTMRLGSWFSWARWCFRFPRSKGMSILSSCGRRSSIWRRNTLNKWRINWLQRRITLSWCSNCWIAGIS